MHLAWLDSHRIRGVGWEGIGRRTVVPAGVSGPEFQLEIAAQS
eukprot:COSAG02_NODE_48452_length_333_cov_1.358974_1_plen_42_part_10